MNRLTRDAILRGVSGAAETHAAFRFREKHENGLSPIDVFGIIEELEIPLEFKALKDLLGACVRISSTEVGILITTQRDLHMQRFTAAHELGHFVLEHEGSLDREVRMPGHTYGRDPREIEADAFAAEFLMPKWLVKAAAQRRQWWGAIPLTTPDVVYQLSLRLAASFEATCWGLAAHEFITRPAAEALVAGTLKELKLKALRGVPLEDPWADVWHLGAGDDGAHLDAGPNDLFIVELEERAAAGFRWEAARAIDLGFSLLDDSSAFEDGAVGGASWRRLVLGAPPPGDYELRLPMRRSFSRSGAGDRQAFQVSVSAVGARKGDSPPAGAPSFTVH